MLKKIVTLEDEIVSSHKLPILSVTPTNIVVQNEKHFDSTCIVLETKGHENPHLLSCKKFFQALEFWEDKQPKQTDDGSRSYSQS